jgi:hypothetical protein
MAGSTTNYAIKFAQGVDKVQKFPAEVSEPGAKTIDKVLYEKTLNLVEHGASFTAKAGELVKCNGAITVTLPAPALNGALGVLANNHTIEITAGAAKIFGDFFEGTACKLLGLQHIVLQSDGTNWYIVAGEPKRESKYEALKEQAEVESVVEKEVSGSRPAHVNVWGFGNAGECIVVVGGVEIGRIKAAGAGDAANLSFYLNAGEKFYLYRLGGLVVKYTAKLL